MDRKKNGFKTPGKPKSIIQRTPNQGKFEFGIDDPNYVKNYQNNNRRSSKTPGRISSGGTSRKLSVSKTPSDQSKKMVDAMTSPTPPEILPPRPPSSSTSITSTPASTVSTTSTYIPPPPPSQHHRYIQPKRSKKKKKRERKSKRKKSHHHRRRRRGEEERRKKKSSKDSYREEFAAKVHGHIDPDLPLSEQYIEIIRLICNRLKKKYSSKNYKMNETDKQTALEVVEEFQDGMEERYQSYFKETVEEIDNPRDEINKAKISLLERKIRAVDEETREWDRIESEINRLEMLYPSMKEEDFNEEEELLRHYNNGVESKENNDNDDNTSIPKLDFEECLGEYELITDSLINYSKNSSVLISEGEEVSRNLVDRMKEMAEIDKNDSDPKDLMSDFLN